MTRRQTPDPVARLDGAAARRHRLARHHLHERATAPDAEQVVADLAGLHAQLASSAALSLAVRVDGLAPDAVGAALEERRLVKTWAWRGTLHLLPAADLATAVGALGTLKPRHHAPSWQRYHGVTRDQADALYDVLPAVLDGPPLTREELAVAVADHTGSANLGERLRDGWGALLKPAAFTGTLCFATDDGRSVRFTRPDRWLGGWTPADPEEAGRDVARRWLAAYGPGSREDLARWLGATPAHAGRMLDRLGGEAVPVEVDGRPTTALAAGLPPEVPTHEESVVRLLPAFDAYVVGSSRDADDVVPAEHRDRVHRPQGWISPVLLVDGVVAGTWSHERTRHEVRVDLAPFAELQPPCDTVPTRSRTGLPPPSLLPVAKRRVRSAQCLDGLEGLGGLLLRLDLLEHRRDDPVGADHH